MKIEVSSDEGAVVLKVLTDEEGGAASMPTSVVGKLEAMLSKAKSHSGYKSSLECVEGKWKASEAFDLNT